MARSKRRHWTDDEAVRAVAYLDHYTQKRRENGKWSDEAVLTKIASHIKSRSSKQIRGKLLTFWETPNTSTRTSFQDVFKYGSRYLNLLPDELKPQIQNTLKAIELDEHSEKMLTPQILRSGKERSASVDVRRPSPQHSSSRAETSLRNPSKRLRKRAMRQRSLAAVLRSNEVDRSFEPSLDDGTGCTNSPSQTPLDRSKLTADMTNIVKSTPLRNLEDHGDQNLRAEPKMTRRRLFDLGDVPRLPVTDRELESDPPSLSMSKTDWGLQTLRDLLEDNRYFRQKCLEMEAERSQRKWANRVASSLERLVTQDPSLSLLLVIQQKEQTINELERRLKSQDFVQPFLQFCDPDTQPSNFDKVENAFQGLTASIYRLAETEEPKSISKAVYATSSPALQALSKRCLPSGPLSQRLDTDMTEMMDQSTPTMTAIFTGAAVCEWVFLSDIQCAILMSTPIHESYRYHLRAICGEQGVKSFDNLAYQSVLQDVDFREVYIKRTAISFAQRLLEALHDNTTDDIIATYLHQVRQQIQNVFLHALTIRYELLLRDERFGIIWPTTGSRFDDDLMECYLPQATQAARGRIADNSAKVDLTLVPAFQGFPHQKEHIKDIVIFENDVKSGIGHPIWTLKATVSIK